MLVSSVVRLLDAAVIRRLIYTAALLVIGLVAVFIISMQLLGKVQVPLTPSKSNHLHPISPTSPIPSATSGLSPVSTSSLVSSSLRMQWTGRSLTLLDPTYATKYIPIIASVSEHQPTTWTSFFFDLHILVRHPHPRD